MASYDLEGGGARKTEEKKWFSWIVPFFVAVNVVVFVVAMYINNCPSHQNDADGKCLATVLRRFSFQPFKENPLIGPSSATLEKMGALQWFKIVHQHQGWRLVSCIWLHAGLVHLGINMFCLVFIGIRLERQFGFVRVGIIYLLSGFGGSMLSALFIRTNISVGASGALFGLFGAMVSELMTNWTIYSNKASALLTLLFVIAINLAIGIMPFIDNFAHIGGFLTGIFLGFIFLLRPQFRWLERHNLPAAVQVKSKYKIYQLILFGVAIILLLVWFVVGLVMLFRGENGNHHCHWCKYLSCVPTSRWECSK